MTEPRHIPITCESCGRARFGIKGGICNRCQGEIKPPPAGWAEKAACRGHEFLTPESWWPPGDGRDDLTRAALRVCAECPVRVDCLEHALAVGEREGIWGGMTAAQRREEARSRRRLQDQRNRADHYNRRAI